MLEKTFSTFHTSNVLLQQQYREKGFKTYAELISCLLLAEQNNELLMRNSEMRPVGSAAPPEAHNTEDDKESHHVQGNGYYGRGRGSRYGRGRGSSDRGRGNQNGRDHGHDRGSFGRGHGRGRGSSFKPQHSTKLSKSVCHRCGMDNHWDKTCRTPKHLVELYQESLKGKILKPIWFVKTMKKILIMTRTILWIMKLRIVLKTEVISTLYLISMFWCF